MSMVIGAPYLGTSEKMLAMRLFTCFLQLMPGLALPAVSPQQLAVSAENNSSEVEVVPFQDVWARSYCRVLEKLVNVVSEYPEEMQYMFNPSCVSLLRCSGCCGDESLRCMPVETYNVTMQIVRMSSEERPTYVEMSFTQHSHWKTEALSLSNRLINRDTFLLTSGPTATALKACLGEGEARKEETQGQWEEEESEEESHRLPPMW